MEGGGREGEKEGGKEGEREVREGGRLKCPFLKASITVQVCDSYFYHCLA